MTAVAILAAGFAVAAVVAWSRLPALHPAQLWLIPWTAVLVLYVPNLLRFTWPSATTVALIAGGTAAFCAGTLLAGRLARRRRGTACADTDPVRVEAAAALLVSVTAALLIAFLLQVAAEYGPRAAVVPTPEVRLALGAGFASVTIKYLYFAYAAAAVSAIAAARCEVRARRWLWAAAALGCIGSQYFTTGRSNVLLCAITAGVAYALTRRRPVAKARLAVTAAALTVLAVPLFLGMGALLGKDYAGQDIATYDHVFNDHPGLQPLGTPYQYATAPIAALDVVVSVTPVAGRAHGCASLATACAGLDRLGLPAEAEPKLTAFTAPPTAWNTFTALYAPLVDAGPWGALLILALEGLAVGLLWTAAARGSALGVAAYAPMATAVAYSTVENNLLAPHLIGAALLGAGALLAARRVAALDGLRGRALTSMDPR